MAERDAFDAEAEERRWWEAWWAEDYSWEGLDKRDADGVPEKPWHGWVVVRRGSAEYCKPIGGDNQERIVRPASLQDYWRSDPKNNWQLRSEDALRTTGELTKDRFDEQHWHIAHVPHRLKSGTKSGWKQDLEHGWWHKLNILLSIRIEAAKDTPLEEIGFLSEEDGRAQLDVAILKNALPEQINENAKLHASMRFIYYIQDAKYQDRKFGRGVDFSSSKFGGKALFSKAQFAGYSNFTGAKIDSYAGFDRTVFSGDVIFDRVTFSEKLNFKGAKFKAEARFRRADIAGVAEFTNAIFAGPAWIAWSRFRQSAWFGDVLFQGNARFEGSQFAHNAVFNGAQFSGRIGFSNACFLKEVDLRPTRGAAINQKSNEFPNLSFNGALCLYAVDFSDRSFAEAPEFKRTHFHDLAVFHGAALHDGVNLTEAKFAFDNDLKPVSWNDLAARMRREDEIVPTITALTSVLSGNEKSSAHLAFWRASYEAWEEYIGLLNQQPKRADRFEASYRRLKLLMRGIGSHIEEQRFFALELRARKARTDGDIKEWEKWAAAAYGKLADYGQSALRPFLWLGASIIVFASAYLSLAHSACAFNDMACAPSAPAPIASAEPYWIDARPMPVRLVDAYAWQPFVGAMNDWFDAPRRRVEELPYLPGPLLFAVELGFIPVSDPMGHHTWAKNLAQQDSWQSALFAFLRMTQRLISLILIFLTALALRRRFQIG